MHTMIWTPINVTPIKSSNVQTNDYLLYLEYDSIFGLFEIYYMHNMKLLSSSSHIFVFWYLVDNYEKPKIPVKFVYFYKKCSSCLIFFEVKTTWQLIFWCFGDQNMRWTGHLDWVYADICIFKRRNSRSITFMWLNPKSFVEATSL